MIVDMPAIGPMWAWALGLVIVVGYLYLGWLIHRAPTQAPDMSRLDAADGLTYTPRCVMAHCGLAGTIARVTRADLGIETVRVCPGHADEGSVKGWWAFGDSAPYDQEAPVPSYDVLLEMALRGSAYEVVRNGCTELTCPQHGEANRRARGDAS